MIFRIFDSPWQLLALAGWCFLMGWGFRIGLLRMSLSLGAVGLLCGNHRGFVAGVPKITICRYNTAQCISFPHKAIDTTGTERAGDASRLADGKPGTNQSEKEFGQG